MLQREFHLKVYTIDEISPIAGWNKGKVFDSRGRPCEVYQLTGVQRAVAFCRGSGCPRKSLFTFCAAGGGESKRGGYHASTHYHHHGQQRRPDPRASHHKNAQNTCT